MLAIVINVVVLLVTAFAMAVIGDSVMGLHRKLAARRAVALGAVGYAPVAPRARMTRA